MADVYHYEIAEALRRRGCVLCRVRASDESRAIATFWREAKNDPGVRSRFFASGGFCQRHAWLLDVQVSAADRGTAAADVYRWLAHQDLARLDTALGRLGKKRRRAAAFERGDSEGCLVCRDAGDATVRKAHFLVQLLAEEPARERYLASDGLCIPHLELAAAHALGAAPGTARLLLEDCRARLERLHADLVRLVRDRDARRAGPDGDEPWTEAIRRYAGEDFARRAE